MLRLGRGLRRLGSGRGAGDSGRLPLSAEMPKKAGATSKGKSQTKEPETPLPPLGPVAVDPKGCVTVAIHAKPGSKQNAVTGHTRKHVQRRITAFVLFQNWRHSPEKERRDILVEFNDHWPKEEEKTWCLRVLIISSCVDLF